MEATSVKNFVWQRIPCPRCNQTGYDYEFRGDRSCPMCLGLDWLDNHSIALDGKRKRRRLLLTAFAAMASVALTMTLNELGEVPPIFPGPIALGLGSWVVVAIMFVMVDVLRCRFGLDGDAHSLGNVEYSTPGDALLAGEMTRRRHPEWFAEKRSKSFSAAAEKDAAGYLAIERETFLKAFDRKMASPNDVLRWFVDKLQAHPELEHHRLTVGAIEQSAEGRFRNAAEVRAFLESAAF